MKKFLLTAICAGITFAGLAQGQFKFEEESFDFGSIKEGDRANHTFKFKNVGNEPIVITRVKASCGCTTPSWTREPVPPGGTGEVKASYNSTNRPGGFHKSITITSNAKSPTKVLRINGVAEKEPARVYTAAEKAASPRLAVADNDHNFGNIELGQQASHKFKVTNTGKSDLEIKNLKSRCNCVSFNLDKAPLKPGETGTLTVSYKPRIMGDHKEAIKIQTNDIVTPIVNISVRANVVQDVGNKSIIQSDDKITF